MRRKKLRKEQNLETLALVDRSVKDLSSTMQKFEDKEKQAGTPPPPSPSSPPNDYRAASNFVILFKRKRNFADLSLGYPIIVSGIEICTENA
jgi:hypothetical protein